jgi:hypothetical protein
MKQVSTVELGDLDLAKIHINSLQDRLLACEQALDDVVRAYEIAQASGQYQLVQYFVSAAEKILVDRLEVVEKEVTNINVTRVVEDDT